MDDELITDPAELSMYSQDMSRYRIIPKATFEARSEDDVLRAILLARKEGLSITCRGAGSTID
jgi:FAD/FMN-containing dehydrogenase